MAQANRLFVVLIGGLRPSRVLRAVGVARTEWSPFRGGSTYASNSRAIDTCPARRGRSGPARVGRSHRADSRFDRRRRRDPLDRAQNDSVSDAGVEFSEGDTLLGRAQESADMRSFTLTAAPKNPAALQVRSAGRRLDVTQPAPPASLTAPELPALLPEAAVDPGKPGPFGTTKGEYVLDPVRFPGYAQPIEMDAVVVAPKGAPGKRPLVLFLHGRHFTCFSKTDPNRITIDWPCAADMTPVPSHRGYLKARTARLAGLRDSLDLRDGSTAGRTIADAVRSVVLVVRHHWRSGRGRRPRQRARRRQSAPADMSKYCSSALPRWRGRRPRATDSITPPPGDTGLTAGALVHQGDVLIGPRSREPAARRAVGDVLPGCDGDGRTCRARSSSTRSVASAVVRTAQRALRGRRDHDYYNSEWTPGQAEAPASTTGTIRTAPCARRAS